MNMVKCFKYLDSLRESGATSMYGARPWLQNAFDLDKDEAGKILSHWMKTFDRDKTPEERASSAEA